jgi:cell pole-organizing protein PopZ
VQSPEGLVSAAAASEIANTVGSLVRSVSAERAVTVGRPGVTIEDLVREEIKPVLKSWLDTHLPNLVERVVRTEIGRVIDRMQP